jgi:ABC-type Zn uptake system ZnuABC Zn-binding protein ZnuA
MSNEIIQHRHDHGTIHVVIDLSPELANIFKNNFPTINQKLDKMANELNDLTTNVSKNTDVIESAITLLGNIKSLLDAAGTDPVKLKALSDTLASEDQKLADAIVANTPAQP